jgi:hypothetical protein
MVVIDELHGTNIHRSDISIVIKNYREEPAEQHEIIKKENPYQNGGLRKKGKGGYRKY